MDSAKAQLADRLKTANNILVTVSRNPSVDQLSACIGLTLLLNKLGKHAAAVFSGQVPSTIEFLKPEDTLEKNTDSLRDFIIALDKSKADKLRYKVEDNVVRIFITPYKTSISQDDLEFSQGDFNVDVVVALGVSRQEELDEAITAHGRILHDATVAAVTTAAEGGLGSINWNEPQASSLSELMTDLAQMIGSDLLDGQIATALLTGIVAETDRFSNDKTSPNTMSASATLMAAGANQQLVASKLEESSPVSSQAPSNDQNSGIDSSGEPQEIPKANDGTLEISHDNEATKEEAVSLPPVPEVNPLFEDNESNEPLQDKPMNSLNADIEPDKFDQDESNPPESIVPQRDLVTGGSKLVTEAPTLGGVLTANTQPEGLDGSVDPLSAASNNQSNSIDYSAVSPKAMDVQPLAITPSEPDQVESSADAATPPIPNPAPQLDSSTELPSMMPQPIVDKPKPIVPDLITGLTPPPPAWVPPSPDPFNLNQAPQAVDSDETLSQIEQSVHSSHLSAPSLDEARDEVSKALVGSSDSPEPIQALNAQPLGGDLHPSQAVVDQTATPPPGPDDLATILANAGAPTLGGTTSTAPPLPTPYQADSTPSPAVSPDSAPQVTDPNAPPPVPPPLPFQYGPPK